jgi:hypothetical protein
MNLFEGILDYTFSGRDTATTGYWAIARRAYLMRFLLISGIGFTRNFVANIVKRIIGMEVYFNQSEILFRHYIAYSLGIRSAPRITSRGFSGEGAGSQARTTMLAINFARVLNVPYVHSPFSEISHADRPMELWLRAWEAEFNLGAEEIQAKIPDHDTIDFAKNFWSFIPCFGHQNIYQVFNFTHKRFREKYYSDKVTRLNPLLIVGVHVRRGDISSDTPEFWTELASIATTIAKIKNALDKRTVKYRILVFSEGAHSEFSDLESLEVELLLNADPVWTMRELIEADILVMAKSSFSYCAAIISDGIKLYEPFGLPPLKGWLVRQPKGDFDERHFAVQLEATCRTKGAIK